MNAFTQPKSLARGLALAGLLWLTGALTSTALAQGGCANQSATLPAMPAQAPGLGGTGLQAIKPGVGGTGMDDPGIGGTGIVGVITGFASICVNGVEVHFDDSTPINEDEQPATMRALAVGKVVAIQAQATGTEFVARRIAVLNSLVGPVDAIHPTTGALSVLGQNVTAPPGRVFAAIRVGEWVQVSGHRRANGQIEASYLSPVAPQGLARMSGWVERNMGVDLVVSGTDVNLAGAAQRAVNFLRGDELTVEGVWDGKTLRARSAQPMTAQDRVGAVRELVVEGFVHAVTAQSISLGGRNFALGRSVQVEGQRGRLQDVAVDQLVRMTGRVDAEQRIRVDRIEIRRSASGRGASKSKRNKGDEDASDKSEDDGEDASDTSGKSDDVAGDDRADSDDKDSDRDNSGSGSRSVSRTADTAERSEGSGKSDSSGKSGRSGGSDSSGRSSGSGRSGGSSGSGKGK